MSLDAGYYDEYYGHYYNAEYGCFECGDTGNYYNYNTAPFHEHEFEEAVWKFKRRKAAGPDEVPMEVF